MAQVSTWIMVNIKKLNIHRFYRIDKNNNNFFEYKRHFNSQKNMFNCDSNNFIKYNKEKNNLP